MAERPSPRTPVVFLLRRGLLSSSRDPRLDETGFDAVTAVGDDAHSGSLFRPCLRVPLRFHELLTGPPDVKADGKSLGKLAVFSGVREFPVRVKCATLAWHTLESALAGTGSVASTEAEVAG